MPQTVEVPNNEKRGRVCKIAWRDAATRHTLRAILRTRPPEWLLPVHKGAGRAHTDNGRNSNLTATGKKENISRNLATLALVPYSGDVAISASKNRGWDILFHGCAHRPVKRIASLAYRSLAAGLPRRWVASAVRNERHLHLAGSSPCHLDTAARRYRFRVTLEPN